MAKADDNNFKYLERYVYILSTNDKKNNAVIVSHSDKMHMWSNVDQHYHKLLKDFSVIFCSYLYVVLSP